ncbi:MAG: hypothetical protein ACRDP7_08505 [Trebonia sp.]
MTAATAAGTAVVFVWLGMVLAISFLEAPLKFRAPGVTVPIGLGIGRLVFRALNSIELGFAAALVAVTCASPPSAAAITAVAIAVAVLLAQLALVRPRLSRRTDAVLAGEDAPRSFGHHAYIVLELAKTAALLTAGILLLQSAR